MSNELEPLPEVYSKVIARFKELFPDGKVNWIPPEPKEKGDTVYL